MLEETRRSVQSTRCVKSLRPSSKRIDKRRDKSGYDETTLINGRTGKSRTCLKICLYFLWNRYLTDFYIYFCLHNILPIKNHILIIPHGYGSSLPSSGMHRGDKQLSLDVRSSDERNRRACNDKVAGEPVYDVIPQPGHHFPHLSEMNSTASCMLSHRVLTPVRR